MPNASLADVPEDRIDDASAAAQQRLERLADAIARRTQLRLIQQKAGDDARQAELDRLQQDFDFSQKERAELLREFNLMRDLALEQTKKDDEAVKKWMALV
jgi:predicted secreted protein